MSKNAWTYVRNKYPIKGASHKIWYDGNDLQQVNRVRRIEGKNPLDSLNGYCMSTGCSCRDHNGNKGLPICSLFKCYDGDGIKKDFIYQILGI